MNNHTRPTLVLLSTLITGFFLLILAPAGFSYTEAELRRLYRKYKNDKAMMNKLKEEYKNKKNPAEGTGTAEEIDSSDAELPDDETASESEDPDQPADENATPSAKVPQEPSANTAPEKPGNPEAAAAAAALSSTATDAYNQRFCDDHLKQARQHLKTGDVKHAKEEIATVIKRNSEHPEARFMNAVLCAKEKNFVEAWQNIEIAQKGDPDNQKMKDFVTRLQKAHPKPDGLPLTTATATAPVTPKP